MKQQKAKLSYADITPRKLRLVADAIKGLTVNEAEAQLSANPRRAARKVLKLLQSAAMNAKNNQKLDPDSMIVSSVRIDGAPSLKRWLPRARGSATPILKRRSHMVIVLEEREKIKPPRFKPKIAKVVKEKKIEKKEDDKKMPERELPEKKAPSSSPGFFKKIFRRKSV